MRLKVEEQSQKACSSWLCDEGSWDNDDIDEKTLNNRSCSNWRCVLLKSKKSFLQHSIEQQILAHLECQQSKV